MVFDTYLTFQSCGIHDEQENKGASLSELLLSHYDRRRFQKRAYLQQLWLYNEGEQYLRCVKECLHAVPFIE
jgi:hypothetical protein